MAKIKYVGGSPARRIPALGLTVERGKWYEVAAEAAEAFVDNPYWETKGLPGTAKATEPSGEELQD